MINTAYDGAVKTMRLAGEKLSEVAINASPETATGDLSQSIIQAKLAVNVAEASAAVLKRSREMEDALLDILA